ncbi:hypothetical protein [Prescottella sp. R16]|uniref:hypothetical protein n=1 Tax=Prescottella sp. R16 TaxID=3064529 RepID=UPI00272E50C6|nr:hypothetical protein [Prescottella sp. R16]
MGEAPSRSWWDDYNDGVRRMHETGWGADASVLSPAICELLDDVDAAFVVTGVAEPAQR